MIKVCIFILKSEHSISMEGKKTKIGFLMLVLCAVAKATAYSSLKSELERVSEEFYQNMWKVIDTEASKAVARCPENTPKNVLVCTALSHLPHASQILYNIHCWQAAIKVDEATEYEKTARKLMQCVVDDAVLISRAHKKTPEILISDWIMLSKSGHPNIEQIILEAISTDKGKLMENTRATLENIRKVLNKCIEEVHAKAQAQEKNLVSNSIYRRIHRLLESKKSLCLSMRRCTFFLDNSVYWRKKPISIRIAVKKLNTTLLGFGFSYSASLKNVTESQLFEKCSMEGKIQLLLGLVHSLACGLESKVSNIKERIKLESMRILFEEQKHPSARLVYAIVRIILKTRVDAAAIARTKNEYMPNHGNNALLEDILSIDWK
ncbi:uncharacterized protein NEMAJ01_1653 [Nematocida major]|uniref:uncharacterized protein n=1 Tax=Nematocida major TaxID=1912982 RepID=UPI002007AFDC|nr:uncharacterized protein NEMAJ01_1653 [Nematocida major]KAH9386757.1 hypothetical protein NEMAJ01_1653 [Nematocida major]